MKAKKRLFGFARGLTKGLVTVYGIMVHAYRNGKLCLFLADPYIPEDKSAPILIPVIKASLRVGEDKNGSAVYDDDVLSYKRADGSKFMLIAHHGEWEWKETELKRDGGFYNKNLCIWLDECELN